MEEGERARRIAKLREFIVRRIEELETELSGLREVLRFVDELLKELSFKELSLPEEAIGGPRPQEVSREEARTLEETVIPLTTIEGELLANMYVAPGRVRIVPAEDKRFHASSRPFQYFLRQLKGVQDRDASLVAEGVLSPDKVTTFNVVTDGDVIREVIIKNVKPKDVRKLKSIARWAFRTMWQQMTGLGAAGGT